MSNSYISTKITHTNINNFSGVTATSIISSSQNIGRITDQVVIDKNGVIDLSHVCDSVIVRTKDGDVNLSQLAAMMRKMDRLLCVVEEAVKLDPNNESLMSAYEQYRMVEELTR